MDKDTGIFHEIVDAGKMLAGVLLLFWLAFLPLLLCHFFAKAMFKQAFEPAKNRTLGGLAIKLAQRCYAWTCSAIGFIFAYFWVGWMYLPWFEGRPLDLSDSTLSHCADSANMLAFYTAILAVYIVVAYFSVRILIQDVLKPLVRLL